MSRIKTYEDLEAEKKRLLALLKNHEEAINIDIAGVKQGLKPVGTAVNFLSKMATRDNRVPAMNFGLEMGIDLLVRRVLLSRAGWFAKIVVPYVVKNYSSHLLADEKRELIVNKVRAFLQKLRPKKGPQHTKVYTPQQPPPPATS